MRLGMCLIACAVFCKEKFRRAPPRHLLFAAGYWGAGAARRTQRSQDGPAFAQAYGVAGGKTRLRASLRRGRGEDPPSRKLTAWQGGGPAFAQAYGVAGRAERHEANAQRPTPNA
jgi:hypothetical protein